MKVIVFFRWNSFTDCEVGEVLCHTSFKCVKWPRKTIYASMKSRFEQKENLDLIWIKNHGLGENKRETLTYSERNVKFDLF